MKPEITKSTALENNGVCTFFYEVGEELFADYLNYTNSDVSVTTQVKQYIKRKHNIKLVGSIELIQITH